MVSPYLIKKKERKIERKLNLDSKRLFQVIYQENKKEEEEDDDSIPKVKVSALVSKAAFFYEKIRNAIDYDEEHLLRKNAINRILKRQIIIEGAIKGFDSNDLAKHLLVELIRGRYLPNNSIPETKIDEISLLIQKYIILKDRVMLNVEKKINVKDDLSKMKELMKEKNRLTKWILLLAACEIEDNLGHNEVKHIIVNNMFSVLHKQITLADNSPYIKDLSIQIYLSIIRTYSKFDQDMVSFVLFKYYNKVWLDINKEGIDKDNKKKIYKIADHIYSLYNLIEKQINHPLRKQIDKVVRPYSVYFSILEETIKEDPIRIYNLIQYDDLGFEKELSKVINKRYQKVKKKLWRAAVRSIIYIFLTKSLFATVVEVPAIKLFGEVFNPISLVINISFPAILLFFIVLTTKNPDKNNTKKIIKGVKSIIEDHKQIKARVLRPDFKRKGILSFIFRIIYGISFLVSVYFIIRVLTAINFTWVSITIFLFFLAFVSFFSVIITKGVKGLIVVEKKDNFFTFLRDLFYMPIIMVGRWMSGNFSKVNVIIFVFDFIIEAPFKVLIEVGEDWIKYVKERRENMES